MEDKNTYTLGKLKKFLAGLSKQQLKQKVHVAVDDQAAQQVSGHDIVKHDIYVHINDDEDCGTINMLKAIHGKDFNIKDYEMRTPAGTAFLFISENETNI